MKHLLIILVVFNSIFVFSQAQNVRTKISADNIFELSIIQIYPDSFPTVSVIFQAKNASGKPLWLLKKTELNITENGVKCDVLKLVNISKNKPVNIGLVFDYSGSMLENPEIDKAKMEEVINLYFSGLPVPKDFVSSLDYAKQGVLEFLHGSGNSSDSILFVGFSEKADKILPLTNDFKSIESFMNELQPTGGTAFYDAIYEALDNLSKNSSNSVVIAMTDGQDNMSSHTYDEVIAKSKASNIPIYIIGLGDVDKYSLKQMCKLTDGFFYQTNDPNKLKEIYLSIKKQIQSIYQVDYRSNCTDFENREIRFTFVNDTLKFSNNSERYMLPKEALEYLHVQAELRQQREQEEENLIWILAGGGAAVMMGFGGFLVYKRKKNKRISIENAFPNPFENELTIAYSLPSNAMNPVLNIYYINGQKVKSVALNSGNTEIKVETNELNRGVYLLKIEDGSNVSNSMKVVKK